MTNLGERRRHRGFLLLVGVAVLMGVPGCLWVFQQEFVEPEFDIRDRYVMVLPFRHKKYWYGETQEGRQLALRIGYEIQAECDGVVHIHADEVEAMLANNVQEPVPWKELGTIAEADYLIFGTIRRLSLKNPRMVAMLTGELRCLVRVYNVDRDMIEYEREIEVRHPKDPSGGQIQIAFEQNEPQVKRKLYALMGTEIQRLLCGWVRDKSHADGF